MLRDAAGALRACDVDDLFEPCTQLVERRPNRLVQAPGALAAAGDKEPSWRHVRRALFESLSQRYTRQHHAARLQALLGPRQRRAYRGRAGGEVARGEAWPHVLLMQH